MAITGQVRRRRIVINADAYISSATSNVPVLIKFNSTDHPDIFATGDTKNSVWFSTDAGGQTTLYHEGVVFDSTDAIFYVKVDLSSTADTVIYFWYGTPAITGTESKANVWTNAQAIYHFEGGATDSSANGYNLTVSGATNGASYGYVGSGYSFDGNDYAYTGSNPTDGTKLTVMSWVKTTSSSANRTIASKASTPSNIGWVLYISGTEQIMFHASSDGSSWDLSNKFTSAGAISEATWTHVAGVFDNGNWYAYADAVSKSAAAGASKAGDIYDAAPIYVGAFKCNTLQVYYLGSLDEVWIFTDAKSADFIKAVYNNAVNYSTFITIDGAVTIGSSPKMICPVWPVSSGTVYEENDIAFGVTYAPSITQSEQAIVSDIAASVNYVFGSGGYPLDFANRIKLTIDHTKVGSTLENFPVLVKLSSSSGIADEDLTAIFTELTTNSKKIAVTTSDGQTQCYVEIERWDNENNLAILWVKVPSVSTSADTILYLYYDSSADNNTTYIGDTDSEVAENVWDSNFKAVYHLNSESSIKDSTTNDNDGTITGTLSLANGQIGKAVSIGTNEYITLTDTITLTDYTWTISYWLKEGGGAFDCVLGSDTNYHLIRNTNVVAQAIVQAMSDTTNLKNYRGNYTRDTDWHCYIVRRTASGNNVKIFVDGQETTYSESTMADQDLTLDYIGRFYAGVYSSSRTEGLLEELRVSNSARSDNWIVADYNSQNDSLITYDIEGAATGLGVELVLIAGAKEYTVNYSCEVTTGLGVVEESANFEVDYSFELTAITVYNESATATITYTFLAEYGRVDVEEILFEADYTITDLTPVVVFAPLIEFETDYSITVTSIAIYTAEILFEVDYGSSSVGDVVGQFELIEFGVTYGSLEVSSNRIYGSTVEFTANYSLEVTPVAVYLAEITFTADYGSWSVAVGGAGSELIEFTVTYDPLISSAAVYLQSADFTATYAPEVSPVTLSLALISTTVTYAIRNYIDAETIGFGVTYSATIQDIDVDIELIEFTITYAPEVYVEELIEFGVNYGFRDITEFPDEFGSWDYRKTKEVVGAASEQTNYQIRLTLHYGSGTDDNNNVYLNSHCNADFSDIRFVHGDQKLDYFIEDYISQDYAIVWIEMDSISTDGETIYIYYGNTDAISESSGANTFIQYYGYSEADYLQSEIFTPTYFRYRCKIGQITPVTDEYNTYFGLTNSDQSQYLKIQLLFNTSTYFGRWWGKRTSSESGSTVNITAAEPKKFSILRSGGTVDFREDNYGSIGTIPSNYTQYIPDDTLGLMFFDAEEYIMIYWAFIAKYIYPEPYFSTTGDEEANHAETGDVNLDLLLTLPDIETSVTYALEILPFNYVTLIEFSATYTFLAAAEGEYESQQGLTVSYSFSISSKVFIDLDQHKIESISVNKSIQDVTWNCDIKFDGIKTIVFFKHVTIQMADHNGVDRTVFVGFIPTSKYTLADANNKSNATAYDYSWYLSVQIMPDEYLITDEEPSVIINDLLGDLDWESSTGINPYQLRPVSDWATTKKTFVWDRKTTKLQAIQEICDYCKYIFLIKWKLIGEYYYPVAYFVPKGDIDTYLELPAAITIAAGVNDSEVIDGINIDNTQVESINRVIVKGIDALTGTYYDSVVESVGVSAGEEVPIEFYHESADLNTQIKADAKAQEIYDLLSELPKTYEVGFVNRTDLELYQKIKFVGFDEIDEEFYRIIGINYTQSGISTTVRVKLAKDDDLSNIINILRNNSLDFVNNVTNIVDSRIDKLPTVSVGRILSITGSTALVELEDGSGQIEVRLLNQE